MTLCARAMNYDKFNFVIPYSVVVHGMWCYSSSPGEIRMEFGHTDKHGDVLLGHTDYTNKNH